MAKRKSFILNRELQEGLTQTMTAVKHYAGGLRFEIIPLQQIEFDPNNPRDLALEFVDLPQGPAESDPLYNRKMEEISRLNSLAETINTQGLINPVVVYKQGGHYRLVAGERRCLASKIAGKSEIKANILNEKPTEYRQRLLQWIENIEREDLTLWERLINIKMILSAYQKHNTNEEEINPALIKNILGCSTPHANNYFVVLKAPKVVLEAIELNHVKNLEKAAITARASVHQKSLLEACIAGASLKQMKQLVEKAEHDTREQKKAVLANKLAAGRGKKASRIDLGSVSDPVIVKTLIKAVIAQDNYRHYHTRFENMEGADYSTLGLAFKELLAIIHTVESR